MDELGLKYHVRVMKEFIENWDELHNECPHICMDTNYSCNTDSPLVVHFGQNVVDFELIHD